MKDIPQGLRIETAASVIIRSLVQDHLAKFAPAIRRDRAAGQSVHIEYVNGLAGVIALMVAGGHGSRDDIVNGTIAKLREYVDRDLRHLSKRTVLVTDNE